MQPTPGFAVLVALGGLSEALYASTIPVALWRKSLRPTTAPLAVRPT